MGTHWFQYQDQSTTGRGDGENCQIGFVDICDTPYPEIVSGSRAVGRDLYEYRSGVDAATGRPPTAADRSASGPESGA